MKTHLIIHQSETKDSPLADISAIRDWHVRVNGWRCIGYQWVIDRIKGRPEIIMGRWPDDSGAHAGPRFNKISEGICVVGNYDIAAPDEEVLAVLRNLCLWRMKERGTIPIENVLGHREAQAQDGVHIADRKSCPGKLFDMDAFRRTLEVKF